MHLDSHTIAQIQWTGNPATRLVEYLLSQLDDIMNSEGLVRRCITIVLTYVKPLDKVHEFGSSLLMELWEIEIAMKYLINISVCCKPQ